MYLLPKIISHSIILLCLLPPIGLWAQATEHRDVKPFDKLMLDGDMEVVLRKGNVEAVEIETIGISPELIFLRNKGNILEISLVQDPLSDQVFQAKVIVIYTDITQIQTANRIRLTSENRIETPSLSIIGTSSTHIQLGISVTNLEIDADNGIEMILTGSATNIKAALRNGSQLKAYGLLAKRARIEANSGSDVKLVVSESIEADASRGSGIHFKGEPREAIIKTTFGGKVYEE